MAVGQPVTFNVTARETHEPGSLSYQLAYGDGATDQNLASTLCRAGPGSLAQRSWQQTHRYAATGTYRAAVTVSARCTPDRTTAQVTVTVR
jgi:PKD domain